MFLKAIILMILGMFCLFINGYDDNAFLQSYLNFLLGVRMIVQEAMTKDPITITRARVCGIRALVS